MVARYRDAGGLPFRARRTPDYYRDNLSEQPVPPEPHPELGAETRTLHLWLVESALYFHGAGDVAAISAAVCLPPFNVERHLFALGLGPDPRRKVVKKPNGTPTSRGGRPL